MERVTVVIVNFESGDRLASLLRSLQSDDDTNVIVVDNHSQDDSASPAGDHAVWAGVEFIRNDRNIGFAAAANQGAAAAGAAASEWLLFLNPDTEIAPGFMHDLVSGVEPGVGAIAPLQQDREGRLLSESGGYHPSLKRFGVWAVLPSSAWGDRGPWISPSHLAAGSGDIDLDWVSGAAMAVRREAFDRLHGFDDRFFLFQEDVDLGKRLRTAGYRIVLRTSLRVRHEVGQADEGLRAAVRGREFVRSLSAGFDGWQRRKLGAILTFGFAWRGLRAGPRGATARAAAAQSLRLWLGRHDPPG
jgi:GT2 family glycosyltransferase